MVLCTPQEQRCYISTCIIVYYHHYFYRPYALTSRLHNNDAMLGVKTCRAARTCCAGRARWRSQHLLSVSAWARAGPAGWHAGVGPLAAYLAMAHVTVPHLTPNTRGRPSVTPYALRSIDTIIFIIILITIILDGLACSRS